MKITSSFSVLFSSIVLISQAIAAPFPSGPDPKLTPGKLCSNAAQYRYPEHVPYCERDVDPMLKVQIIKNYDEQLGYTIERMDRQAFKIDHLIPLCVGGANDVANLWPQHMTVYVITDPLEAELCKKMSAGRLKQVEAVKLVLTAKRHLEQAPSIVRYVQSL